MVQLVQVGRMMGARRPAPPAIRPLSSWYEPEAVTYFNAVAATGTTLSDARKFTINRAIFCAKRDGYWGAFSAIVVPAPTEAAFRVDLTGHGTLTVVGNPTFSANDGVSTSSTNDYYTFGWLPFNVIPQNSHTIGLYAVTGAASANSDMGVLDGTGNFLSINPKFTSNTLNGGSFGVRLDIGTSTFYPGTGVDMLTRDSATNVIGTHNGIDHGTPASNSNAVTSTTPIALLKINGAASFSSRKISIAFVTNRALTASERTAWAANMRNIDDSIRWGEPTIQPAGFGDPIIYCDTPVYCATTAGFIAAYQLVRQGRAPLIICGPYETTVSTFGGMPGCGLGGLDTFTPACVSGLFRTMISWANAKDGRSDNQTQVDMSITGRWWNRVCRWMADPTKADADLPGVAIPIVFAPSIASITHSLSGAGTFTEITLGDSRIIRPLGARGILINCDYEGDPYPLMGISYTMGTEAQGTAPGENLNGFLPSQITLIKDINGNQYQIDPYVPAGVPPVLTPDTIAMPGTATGAADFSLQAMNYRMGITNVASRMAPLPGGGALAQPAGYSAARYVVASRSMAAMNAAGRTAVLNDVAGPLPLNSGGACFDWNSGALTGTDVFQSGINWLAAGASLSARQAIITDMITYDAGFFYWLMASGDPNIPASLITTLQGYGLDNTQFLDPPDGYPLFWPPQLYRRDPIFQMKNAFNFNGHDSFATVGVPRSTNTATVAQYRADRHACRRVGTDIGSGTLEYRLSFINDSSASTKCPIPIAALVPDETECKCVVSPTVMALTKIAWYSARMEATFGLGAQSSAVIVDHALTQGVTPGNVNPALFRIAMLAVPDAVTPVLPQVNSA